jgi:type IV pilus assembly protein PilC
MQIAYVALDERGHEVRGGLEAADPAGAAAKLRGQGLFPVELAEARDAAPSAGAPADGGFAWVRAADVVMFCNQMALMLRTGITLLEALRALAVRQGKAPLRAAARRLSEAVQAGAPLSRALEAEGQVFPPLVAQLVSTAESTGQLDLAFDRAAHYLDRRAALRAQLVSSLIYPAVVVLVSAAVFWFLTTKVVPKFAAFLAGRSVALPWSTQLLLQISDFLSRYGVALALGAAGVAAVGLLGYRTARGRRAFDRVVLSLPPVGGILRTAAMLHLSRTLGLLLRSGLPLLESLRVLEGSFPNRTYAAVVAEAREAVVRGALISEGFDAPVVSPLCRQVMAVGEQTGALDEVLEELGAFYDRQLQQRIKTLATLVEPALLLVIGGMVGLIYLSFFQAVLQLVAR